MVRTGEDVQRPLIVDKIDAVTKIGEDRIAAGGIQPPPKSVKIELTSKCNLRCKYCALRTREVGQSGSNMSLNFFKRITEDMRTCGVEEIGVFYLGESFMAPELLIKAVEWVKKELGFRWVFLTSNGTNARSDHVEAVMDAGLDSLKWSVNFYNETQFEEISGGQGKMLWKMVENIQQAFLVRNEKYHTILSASSILYDDAQHELMQGFLEKNILDWVDHHYWLPMYSMSLYQSKIKKDTGYLPTIGNMGRIDESTMRPNRQPLPCWAAFTEGHVRVDGGLSACCFGADDRFDMGKLDGTNFMKEWNSEKFQRLREAQIATLKEGPDALVGTPCRVCVAYEPTGEE